MRAQLVVAPPRDRRRHHINPPDPPISVPSRAGIIKRKLRGLQMANQLSLWDAEAVWANWPLTLQTLVVGKEAYFASKP